MLCPAIEMDVLLHWLRILLPMQASLVGLCLCVATRSKRHHIGFRLFGPMRLQGHCLPSVATSPIRRFARHAAVWSSQSHQISLRHARSKPEQRNCHPTTVKTTKPKQSLVEQNTGTTRLSCRHQGPLGTRMFLRIHAGRGTKLGHPNRVDALSAVMESTCE